MKNIIFVNRFFYPDISATAQILSDLAFDLAGKKGKVIIVTTTGLYDDPTAHLPYAECCNGVQIYRVYRARFGRKNLFRRAIDYALMYGFFSANVFRLANEDDVIIAKTDPPLLSVALYPVSLLKRAKLVNWLQDLYPEVGVAVGMTAIGLLAPLLKPLRDLSLINARHNVAIGRTMAERLLKLGVSSRRLSVISNWSVGAGICPLAADANPLRREWGLEGKFIVGYSGNLGLAHEFDTLLAAAEHLKSETRLVFLFVGGGALTPALKRAIEQRGLQHLFEFRPYQPVQALHASLTLPDVFWVSLRPEIEGYIVPSKFYGNCAAGRPTIFVGDPQGELARIIAENACGISVPVGQGGRLAEAILTLMGDDQRLQTMGRNAHTASQTTLSRRDALDAWGRLLDSVAGKAQEPAAALGRTEEIN
jgi:glycosyltransferase involved in cell wall biosynthesis